MRIPRATVIVPLLVLTAAAFAEEPPRIAQTHVQPPPRAKLGNILVLGISDDREVRHRFEDKLVTHLRGRGVGASTSYSLVDDLAAPGDRDRILGALIEARVDGVLTVRAVPLDAAQEAAWPESWSAWIGSPTTVRELVEKTIPVPEKAAKRYGVEITLWELGTGNRPWAARTSVCSRKDLRKAAGTLMQETIAQLRELDIF